MHELFGELLCVPKPKDYKNLKARLKGVRLDIAQREEVEAQIRERDSQIEQLLRLAREVHSDFDRCFAGLRFLSEKATVSETIVRPDGPSWYGSRCQGEQGAFRRLPVVKIPSRDGTWDIVVCSRFGFNISPLQEPVDLEVIYRLREPILSDIRAWSSAQDSRIGTWLFIKVAPFDRHFD